MWWNQSLFKSTDPVLPSNQTTLPSYQTVVSHPTDVLKMRSCDLNWNPGLLMFYGRSELKTSDHRLGCLDAAKELISYPLDL